MIKPLFVLQVWPIRIMRMQTNNILILADNNFVSNEEKVIKATKL